MATARRRVVVSGLAATYLVGVVEASLIASHRLANDHQGHTAPVVLPATAFAGNTSITIVSGWLIQPRTTSAVPLDMREAMQQVDDTSSKDRTSS